MTNCNCFKASIKYYSGEMMYIHVSIDIAHEAACILHIR